MTQGQEDSREAPNYGILDEEDEKIDDEIILEKILDNLTGEQEEKLQTYWAEETDEGMMCYDDDMPDSFDNWLGEIDLETVKKILKI